MAVQREIRFDIEFDNVDLTRAMVERQGERTQRKLQEIIDVYSFKIQREAQLRAPVDTGFLRSSIIVDQVEPFYNEVIAGADYAHFVEFGTRFTPAQPFMTPAAQSVVEDYHKDIQRALRWGWVR
jgi:HK97 gp10 family phage protein